jgi:hypothetical protein
MESESTIAIARQKLNDTFPALDSDERAKISGFPDSFRYYKLGGDFADYSIVWHLSSNRLARVFGQGDLLTLGGAKAEIRELPKKKLR